MGIKDYIHNKPIILPSNNGDVSNFALPIKVEDESTNLNQDWFKNGSLSNPISWSTGGLGGSSSIDSNTFYNRGNSLAITTPGDFDSHRRYANSNAKIKDGMTFECWIQKSNSGSYVTFIIGNEADMYSGGQNDDMVLVEWNDSNGVRVDTSDGNSNLIERTTSSFSGSTGDWYKFRFTFNTDGVSKVDCDIFDTEGNNLFSTTNTYSGATSMSHVQVAKRDFVSSTCYFDGITVQRNSINIPFTNISSEKDIAFYDANENLLPYEVESFDSNNNEAFFWVYNDDWSRSGNIQAKIAYGDNKSNDDKSNITGTWDDTLQFTIAAYHFNEDPVTAFDSTSNDNNGTTLNSLTASSGIVDGAVQLDGSSSYIECSTLSGFSDDTSLTISALVYPDTYNPKNPRIIRKRDSSNTDFKLWRETNSGSKLNFSVADGQDSTVSHTANTTLPTGSWYHIVAVYNNALNQFTIYINGQQDSTSSATFDPVITSSNSMFIGVGNTGWTNPGYWDGKIDYLRIHDVAYDGSDAKTEYEALVNDGQSVFTTGKQIDNNLPGKIVATTNGVKKTVSPGIIDMK